MGVNSYSFVIKILLSRIEVYADKNLQKVSRTYFFDSSLETLILYRVATLWRTSDN